MATSSSPTKRPLSADSSPNKKPKISSTSSPTSTSSTSSSVLTPSDTDPVIIAHLADLQAEISQLPWGVQWEIARLISAGYEKFTISLLHELRKLGNNVKAAPEVVRLYQQGNPQLQLEKTDKVFEPAYATELAATSPWEELDREHKLMGNNQRGPGLGCNHDMESLPDGLNPDWYAGRVQFSAKLLPVKGVESRYRIELNRCVLGPSNRMTRYFGSHRFMRIRIPRDAYYNAGSGLIEYLSRPFVLNGRVFRTCQVKSSSVLLFATHEKWEGAIQNGGGMSFLGFLAWFNPMEYNQEQTMVKWAARAVLGTSNSVPGIKVQPHDIHLIDDIISPSYRGIGKVPSEQTMTDGCGFANAAVLRKLQMRLHWDHEPTAVQCRIAGAKGLLLLHPNPAENEKPDPVIWLRPSQIKIKYRAPPGSYLPSDSSKERVIIDVLRGSRLSTPTRLSTEILKAMRGKVEALTTWTGPQGPSMLWDTVSRTGRVLSARLTREMAGQARAKGLVHDDYDDDDEEEGDKLEDYFREHSRAWWDDPVSGCPSSLEETVMVLVGSGFLPDNCPVLKAKLHEVIKKEVNTYVDKFRIDTPMSCTAFIVPDPYGVLRSGEISIRSAYRDMVDQKGCMTDTILGDVVVTRHPCKVPTDTQKVTAVYNEKLRNYVNVIVISTEDHHFRNTSLGRHLASMTGGGDYDGDTMTAFWQPEIVDNFENADPKYAVEPVEVQACLVKNTETVAQFMERVSHVAIDDRIREVQKYMLGPLKDPSLVGRYSTWWENSTYVHGYRHPKTVFLAYLFCAILDGTKTGVTVHPDKYKEHQKEHQQLFGTRIPPWKKAVREKGADHTRVRVAEDPLFLKRASTLGRHVMDEIREWAVAERNILLREVETRFDSAEFAVKLDTDLAKPWRDAEELARSLQEKYADVKMTQDLEKVHAHVVSIYQTWKTLKALTRLPIVERQDRLRQASRMFHSGPEDLVYFNATTVMHLRASCAYVYDYEISPMRWSRFPWDVSMRTLCQIKATALGEFNTVVKNIYSGMQISRAFLAPRA
ncbi:RNA dependent RNA polymerase-domain-containing protein [Amylocystis lapponica]|nr:RNA dependent RNA polymerase-domain-containing protein [Amylocystis lapponica]